MNNVNKSCYPKSFILFMVTPSTLKACVPNSLSKRVSLKLLTAFVSALNFKSWLCHSSDVTCPNYCHARLTPSVTQGQLLMS